MSFIQFVRIVAAQWRIVLIATLGSLAAAALVIKLLPARYEATSRVMMELVKPDPVSGEGISGNATRAYVKTQAELITDYRVAGRVVDQLNWTQSPIYLAAYQKRAKDDTRDFRRWVAQLVIDGTKVKLVDASNILEISYRSSSAESAQVIADAIRQAYVDQSLAFKRDSAGRTAAWFDQQATELRGRLATAEKRMNDFERENGVVLTADNSDTEQDRLRAMASSAGPAAMAVAPIATGPSATQAQVAQIDAQIAEQSKVLGPSHPALQAMQRQRAALASVAAQEASAMRAAASGARATGPSQQALLSEQQRIVLEKRGKVNEAQRLATDVTLLKDNYAKTAARAAALQQQAASPEAGLTLLGSAVAPTSPVFPNKPLIFFGSLGLGLILGILVALIVELLRRRVRGIEDLELVGVPLIGVMGKEQPEPKEGWRPSWLAFPRLRRSAA